MTTQLGSLVSPLKSSSLSRDSEREDDDDRRRFVGLFFGILRSG
jgi:hypothetical protein